MQLAELPTRVAHERARAEEAVPRLLAAGLKGRIATLACDANVHVGTAVGWVLRAAELLGPHGAAIISAKNFSGGAAVWRADVGAAEVALRSAGFCRVERVHLFANGVQEVTIVAWRG